jgi:CHAT domain-containing protein
VRGLEVAERVAGRVAATLSKHADFTLAKGLEETKQPNLIRETLADDSALLMYEFTEGGLVLAVLSVSGLHLFELAAGEKEIEEYVAGFLDAVEGFGRGRAPENADRWKPFASLLYRRLLAPAEDIIKDRERLIVVSDGPLARLPFQDLLRPGVRREDGSVRHEPSISKWVFSYAHSASSFVQLEQRSRRPFSLLVFGDPANGPLQEEASLFSPLPAAAYEAYSVASLFPASRLLAGGAATETALKSGAGDYSVVHLATHGKAVAGVASGAFLLLADDQQNDGLLTVP